MFDQPKTSYSDTTVLVRAISNIISMIDPMDTPVLAALGGLNRGAGLFKISVNNTKVEWPEDSYPPLASAINDVGNWDDTITSGMTVDDASIFKVGDVILVEAEKMVISAISGEDLSVHARGHGSTTAAAHNDDVAVTRIGQARVEGADAVFRGMTDITAPYNYTAISQEGIKMTGTEKVLDYYGFSDSFIYQANKLMPELLRGIERKIFFGERAAGSASLPRDFGGLDTFVGSNTEAEGGGIAKVTIDLLAEGIYETGGNPDLLVMNHAVVNDLRTILDTSSFVQMTQENTVFGMQSIERVRTQYGQLRLVPSRHCPVATAYMLDSRKIGLFELRPFSMYALAKTGDSEKGEVVGEHSLIIANDYAHGTITGITS